MSSTEYEQSGVRVRVRRLAHAAGLPLPTRASPGSAGHDLRAAVAQPLALAPGERTGVPTGLILEIPRGFEGQIRPRSGRALREGLTVVNAPGTIDSDYRGEIVVLLVNLGAEPILIEAGDRIAQLVIAPVVTVSWQEVETALSTTQREEGGFGSTGQ